MRPVIFLGCGLNLEVPLRIAKLCGIPVEGIIDSDYYGNTEFKNGVKIIGSENTFDFESARDQFDFFIGQSFSTEDPRTRKKRLEYISLIEQFNLNCATLIHPASEIYDSVSVGPGCLVGFCTGIAHHVTIGAHTQIHSFAMIGHDATIGQNSCILSHSLVSSLTDVGDNVVMMPGSTLLRTTLNRQQMGNNAIIHPRVTVARDVEPGEIVSLVGNNTRKIYGEVIRS